MSRASKLQYDPVDAPHIWAALVSAAGDAMRQGDANTAQRLIDLASAVELPPAEDATP